MEHSAKDILEMAKRTLGVETETEAVPQAPKTFVKPLADFVITEDGSKIDTSTGEVVEENNPQVEPIVQTTSLISEYPEEPTYVHTQPIEEVEAEVVGENTSSPHNEVAIYEPQASQVAHYQPEYHVPEAPARPYVQATTYNKFADYPQQLREEPTVNTYEIKKLNLAAMVETLEQATQSYQSFPSADAALAIASVSTQVHKLTQELEKANDPEKMANKLESDLLDLFAKEMLAKISEEFKYFVLQSKSMILPEKQAAFQNLMIEIVETRMGPAMQEVFVQNKSRLRKVLGVKERL